MFTGSIPDKVRKYLNDNKILFKDKEICVAASGNFSFEQIISCSAKKIYSSDISLYSDILGNYFTGGEYKKVLKDARFTFLNDLENEYYISGIVLLLEMSKYITQKNLYEKRMFTHYYDNMSGYIEKGIATVQKVKEKIKIDKYFSIDAHLMIKSALNDNMLIASFLPTYGGGYEKIYKNFQDLFDYVPSEYDEIDNEKYIQLHKEIKQGDHFFYTDRPLFNDYILKLKMNNKKDVYLYSNLINKKKYYNYSGLKEDVKQYKLLKDSDEITEKSVIKIQKTNNNVVNHYRFMFLSKKVDMMSNGKYCYLVFIDDKLFGFLIYDNARSNDPCIFLWSDFIINTSHKRLSKLLICLARSHEVITELENLCLFEYKTLRTSVYTDKPVSMKYRSEWKKVKKEPGKLTYETKTKLLTLNEEYSRWYRKHYKK